MVPSGLPSCSSLRDQYGLVACRQVGDKCPQTQGRLGTASPVQIRPAQAHGCLQTMKRGAGTLRQHPTPAPPPPPFPAVPGRLVGGQHSGVARTGRGAGTDRGWGTHAGSAASPVRTPPASGSSSSERAASPGMAGRAPDPPSRSLRASVPWSLGGHRPSPGMGWGQGGGQRVTSRRPACRCPDERARRQARRARSSRPGGRPRRSGPSAQSVSRRARGGREAGPQRHHTPEGRGGRAGRQDSECGRR